MINKKDREKLLVRRKKAIYNMLCKYPSGFAMKNILHEHPSLFTHKLQARNVMNILRKSDRTIKFKREGRDCKYLQEVDVHKLLNELWRIPT